MHAVSGGKSEGLLCSRWQHDAGEYSELRRTSRKSFSIFMSLKTALYRQERSPKPPIFSHLPEVHKLHKPRKIR